MSRSERSLHVSLTLALGLASLVAAASPASALLIYNTSVFGADKSENVVVQPSGPSNGEIVVLEAGSGASITDIDYVSNTEIIVNDNDGFLHDTDSLTLNGTNPDTPNASGKEIFDIDFGATGTFGDPVVSVRDGLTTLYVLRNQSGLARVSFDGLSGADTFNVTPHAGVAVQIEGGLPDGAGDTLNVLSGGAGYTVAVSGKTGGGSIEVAGAAPITFSGIEDLLIDGAPLSFKDCKKKKPSVLSKKVLDQLVCVKP